MESGGVGERAPCFERAETLLENAETFLYTAGTFGPYLCTALHVSLFCMTLFENTETFLFIAGTFGPYLRTALHMSLFCIYRKLALANELWNLYKSSNIVQNRVLICSELLGT